MLLFFDDSKASRHTPSMRPHWESAMKTRSVEGHCWNAIFLDGLFQSKLHQNLSED